ncbi:hypothetical protein [Sphingobacterium griseoflavum]|uniref:Carboxypeptidase regulatory-like domain-containing protein n=1 Tax=Sphingobacterium griseoflavum TaxID=1474952 RepID=A0ABQ3HS84_9SPHI|nr:hypothetical protein [Sphingobacterium griseoflavum]GHE29779.1 hypothetical protein GCM10017764_10990 [Sphingobacterium griseoflavum]
MELKILRQKAKNWAVSGFGLCLGVSLLFSACRVGKRYHDSQGYEIIHHTQDKSGKPVPLLVHGKVTISETGKKAAFATLRFESKKGKIYKTTADKWGFYSIIFDEKYFDGNVDVAVRSGSFMVEDVFFGYSSASEFNIRLYNYDKPGLFVILNKSDIIFIRERSAKEDSLKMELKK